MKAAVPLRAAVHFTAGRLDELQLKDRTVVVIDVLRSGTSIPVALGNGAREVIPVANIENAMKIAGGLSADVTLRAGERGGRRIEGFHLGNSPREFTAPVVKGKSIIFLTTNGTGAVVRGKHARNLVMGGFVNLSSIVSFLAALRSDFLLLCAGKENDFSLEDAVCAGRILNALAAAGPAKLEPNDSATAAMSLDKAHGRSLVKLLRNSDHGRHLESIGLGDDIPVCAAIDSVPALPLLKGTVLRLHGG